MKRLPITVAMTMAMVTRPIPGHLHPPFDIGAIPIRVLPLRCPNARFHGNKSFSDEPECALGSQEGRCRFEPFSEPFADRAKPEGGGGIEQLEPGLTTIDGDSEQTVASARIDITTGSQQTLRWREMDSNFQSPKEDQTNSADNPPPNSCAGTELRSSPDSLPEGRGTLGPRRDKRVRCPLILRHEWILSAVRATFSIAGN